MDRVLPHSKIETPGIAMEIACCPICGSEGSHRFRQSDLLCGLDGVFGQRYCSACATYFLSPRVLESHIDRYYPESYSPFQEDRHPQLIRQLAWALRLSSRRRRRVERFLEGGRILDVGCGNGFFLRTLAGGRWERHAMDTKWHGGADCPGTFYEGRFDRDAPPLAALDAVTLWHVFEHMYHPKKALENAAAVLRPGGFLFLAIPDLQSLEPQLFGKYWVGWDPPRHIATYSALGIENLLHGAGFRLVGRFPDVCTGEMFLLSVDFLLRARGFQREFHRSLLLRILLSPLMYVLMRVGLAPAKVYVAQR